MQKRQAGVKLSTVVTSPVLPVCFKNSGDTSQQKLLSPAQALFPAEHLRTGV